MILTLSIALIILGLSFLVFALCRAAKNGDRMIQGEIDAEELTQISRSNNRASMRSIIGRILE
jgi:hypothetical protein